MMAVKDPTRRRTGTEGAGAAAGEPAILHHDAIAGGQDGQGVAACRNRIVGLGLGCSDQLVEILGFVCLSNTVAHGVAPRGAT
jgi:hypothetical protein